MYGPTSQGLLNMTCMVYTQENVQDQDTGAISKKWVPMKKILCHLDVISHAGADTGDNNKNFGRVYTEEARYLLKTKEPLSKRMRISAIKNRSEKSIFLEIDKIDAPDTIFEIESHHPRLDPLGNILYYESNLRRVGVQTYDSI